MDEVFGGKDDHQNTTPDVYDNTPEEDEASTETPTES
jgi:hypothetical protein